MDQALGNVSKSRIVSSNTREATEMNTNGEEIGFGGELEFVHSFAWRIVKESQDDTPQPGRNTGGKGEVSPSEGLLSLPFDGNTFPEGVVSTGHLQRHGNPTIFGTYDGVDWNKNGKD